MTTQPNKTEFFVITENVLGLVNPDHPEIVHILHASILRGAVNHQDGWMPRPTNDKGMRTATRQDFDDYRISTEWFESHPERFNFPTA